MNNYHNIQQQIKDILTDIEQFVFTLCVYGYYPINPNMQNIINTLEQTFKETFEQKLNIVELNHIEQSIKYVDEQESKLTDFDVLQRVIIEFIKLYRVFLDLNEQYTNTEQKEKFVYHKPIKDPKCVKYRPSRSQLRQDQLDEIINNSKNKQAGSLVAKFFCILNCTRGILIKPASNDGSQINNQTSSQTSNQISNNNNLTIKEIEEVIYLILYYQCKFFKNYDVYFVPIVRNQKWPTEGDVPKYQHILTYYINTFTVRKDGKLDTEHISLRHSIGYNTIDELIEQFIDFTLLENNWGSNFEKFLKDQV